MLAKPAPKRDALKQMVREMTQYRLAIVNWPSNLALSESEVDEYTRLLVEYGRKLRVYELENDPDILAATNALEKWRYALQYRFEQDRKKGR